MTTNDKNVLATTAYRNKLRMAQLDELLSGALVAEKICMVDRTDAYTIQSPYGSQPAAAVSVLTGTYATADYTVTLSTLTVDTEVKAAEHVFGFEQIVLNYDMFANRAMEQAKSIAVQIDQHVLNVMGSNGTGSYTTPVGGFTTAANLPVIISNLLSKVAGYDANYSGTYLVLENTDLVGVIQSQMTAGFNYADKALSNGFIANIGGVDIYVVQSGTFATETSGSESVTMSGCRLFGVKNTCTYAAPRGIQLIEKEVAGKTGKEIATVGLIGAKVWAAKAALTVKITLA
jgi:hypothetical protein